MYAVIRVRGTIKINNKVKLALKSLNLTKPNHCVIVTEDKMYKGLLKRVKDYITWGEVSDKTLKLLKEKRGDYKVFRLNPPKKGFERKGIKKSFSQGGALGYRKDKINDLIMRMI